MVGHVVLHHVITVSLRRSVCSLIFHSLTTMQGRYCIYSNLENGFAHCQSAEIMAKSLIMAKNVQHQKYMRALALIINGCTDRQLMHTGIFIGQLVAYLPNEIHITANYIHMILNRCHSVLAMSPLLSLTRLMNLLPHTVLPIML